MRSACRCPAARSPHLVVGHGPRPRGVEVVEHLHRLGVGDLRAVQRDDGDLVGHLIKDLLFHLTHLGRPRMRSAMMLRWTSEVPPAMVPVKLRAYRSHQLAPNTSLFMWFPGAVRAGWTRPAWPCSSSACQWACCTASEPNSLSTEISAGFCPPLSCSYPSSRSAWTSIWSVANQSASLGASLIRSSSRSA